jgi:DNA-directed RNA polymerase III subunit RPC6
MLYNLEPADDLTGGPWYDEKQGLDEPFVNGLLDVAYRIVDKKSYPPSTKIQTATGTQRIQRFYQPIYRNYATAEDVYDYIIKSKVLHDDALKDTFGVSQVHKLLEVLCYNKQIEKRSDGTYRSILSDEDILDSEEQEYYGDELFAKDQGDALFGHKGYTEAPCGRCPVFKICGNPGEDVSAATCIYWNEWTNRVAPVEYF